MIELKITEGGEKVVLPSYKDVAEYCYNHGLIKTLPNGKGNPQMYLIAPIKKGLIQVNDLEKSSNINNVISNEIITTNNNNNMTTDTKVQEALNVLFANVKASNIDEDKINSLIDEKIKGIIKNEFVIKQIDRDESINVGFTHYNFKKLLNLCQIRKNIFLFGESGSGKSHAAHQVAKGLKLDFYSMSCTADMTASRFLGYNDANGKYVSTLFYEAYKNGGIFLLDEVDNGNGNILNVLNQASSNGSCSFACGMVERHKDFILIAAGNTIGNGASLEFSGRVRLDSAFLKARFIFLDWNIDSDLEKCLVPSKYEYIVEKVQDIRRKAKDKGVNACITPRQTVDIYELIEFCGYSEADAVKMCIYNKLTIKEKEAIQ